MCIGCERSSTVAGFLTIILPTYIIINSYSENNKNNMLPRNSSTDLKKKLIGRGRENNNSQKTGFIFHSLQ